MCSTLWYIYMHNTIFSIYNIKFNKSFSPYSENQKLLHEFLMILLVMKGGIDNE